LNDAAVWYKIPGRIPGGVIGRYVSNLYPEINAKENEIRVIGPQPGIGMSPWL